MDSTSGWTQRPDGSWSAPDETAPAVPPSGPGASRTQGSEGGLDPADREAKIAAAMEMLVPSRRPWWAGAKERRVEDHLGNFIAAGQTAAAIFGISVFAAGLVTVILRWLFVPGATPSGTMWAAAAAVVVVAAGLFVESRLPDARWPIRALGWGAGAGFVSCLFAAGARDPFAPAAGLMLVPAFVGCRVALRVKEAYDRTIQSAAQRFTFKVTRYAGRRLDPSTHAAILDHLRDEDPAIQEAVRKAFGESRGA